MENNDTIYLLKECDAGSKMAVSAIDEVLSHVKCDDMKQLLNKSRKHHETFGNDIHAELSGLQSEEKDPNIMAKGMSWLKTNMKISIDESDETIADLITDGCDMGVKSLYKYLNKYPAASESAKSLCKRLIDIEEELRRDLHPYL